MAPKSRMPTAKDGELIEAENNSCAVKFERDPQGRILKEWQDDYWVSSAIR